MALRLSQQGLLLVGVPLVVEISLLVSLLVVLDGSERQTKLYERSQKITQTCNHLYTAILDAGLTVTGSMVSSDPDYLRRYDYLAEQKASTEDLGALDQLIGTNSPQLRELKSSISDFFQQTNSLRQSSSKSATELYSIARLRPIVARAEKSIKELIAAQATAGKSSTGAGGTAAPTAQKLLELLTITTVTLNTVLALGLLAYFNRSATERLQVLIDNSFRLASDMALNPPLSGSDEFAKLDKLFHDVTKALTAATKKRTELMEMVAHDLRSPLTSVEISLQFLEQKELSAEARKEVARCSHILDSLLRMIDVLLDIEIISSGNVPLERKVVPLNFLIDRAVESVMYNARQKGQTIDFPDEAPKVVADADRIEQVLINLLSNAIKYSGKDTKIRVETTVIPPKWVEVRIIDQGRGIPATMTKKMFSRYEQATAADKKVGKGLGLAICKSIVEAHSGIIGVDSEEGAGSQFWFRLLSGEGNS